MQRRNPLHDEAVSAEQNSSGPARAAGRTRGTGSRRSSSGGGGGPLSICYEELQLDDSYGELPRFGADASLTEDDDEEHFEISAQGEHPEGLITMLSAAAASVVSRVLAFYCLPFRLSWRLMVSAALLAEMMLSTALFKLGIETSAQVEAENLRQELRRVIRHSQRMKERHEEALMRLDQTLREKKQLQCSLRKAKEDLQDLQSGILREGRFDSGSNTQNACKPAAPQKGDIRKAPAEHALHVTAALAAMSVYWLIHQPVLKDLHTSYLLMGTAAAAGFCYLLTVLFSRASAAALVLSWFVIASIFFVSLWRHGISGTQLGGIISALDSAPPPSSHDEL